MVGRLVTALFIAALLTMALLAYPARGEQEQKQYYDFPDAVSIPDDARFLMYVPGLGSRNPTGALLLQEITGQAHVIRQAADEPDDTPKVQIVDKNGDMRMTIFADGSLEIQ